MDKSSEVWKGEEKVIGGFSFFIHSLEENALVKMFDNEVTLMALTAKFS